MSRFGQVGIALGALGIMIAMMGLFPGVTGVEETIGIGVVQVFMLLTGYAMLVFGGLIYAKFTFYLGSKSDLSQQIETEFGQELPAIFHGKVILGDLLYQITGSKLLN